MRLVLGALGTAVVLAGVVASGIQANATTGPNEGSLLKVPLEDRTVGGYDGWWNSTPVDGSPAGPEETVAINTARGKIVDYYNRSKAAAGQSLSTEDTDYRVVQTRHGQPIPSLSLTLPLARSLRTSLSPTKAGSSSPTNTVIPMLARSMRMIQKP